MAAAAHAMARGAANGRAFRGLAGEARAMVQDADKRAEAADMDAKAAKMASDMWMANAAE